MLEGIVEVSSKNILYWLIEVQTHVGMPRGAKMSLALNEAIRVASYKFKHYLQACTTIGKKYIVCKTTNKKS
jgi:hypothetical protein